MSELLALADELGPVAQAGTLPPADSECVRKMWHLVRALEFEEVFQPTAACEFIFCDQAMWIAVRTDVMSRLHSLELPSKVPKVVDEDDASDAAEK